MIPLRNKGKMVGACYETMREAEDVNRRFGYTVATMLVEEGSLYCVIEDEQLFKKMLYGQHVSYAFVRREK